MCTQCQNPPHHSIKKEMWGNTHNMLSNATKAPLTDPQQKEAEERELRILKTPQRSPQWLTQQNVLNKEKGQTNQNQKADSSLFPDYRKEPFTMKGKSHHRLTYNTTHTTPLRQIHTTTSLRANSNAHHPPHTPDSIRENAHPMLVIQGIQHRRAQILHRGNLNHTHRGLIHHR